MALQPLQVGEILDDGVRLFRRHFGVFMRIVAPVAVIYSGLTLVVRLLSVPNDFELLVNGNSTFRTRSLLLSLVGLVVFTVIGGACVHAAGEALVGRTPSAPTSLRTGFRRVLAVLVIAILWMIMLGISAFTVLGWIVPMVGCCVAIPVCMFERLGPLASIRRSWRMSFRRFVPTLAVILSGGLLVFGLGYFATIFSVVSVSSRLSRRGYVLISVITGAGSLAIAVVFVPLVAAWQAVTYTDMRVRQEGLDLAIAIEALPKPQAATTISSVGDAAMAPPRPAPWTNGGPAEPSTPTSASPVPASPRTRPPWELDDATDAPPL